MNCQLCHRRATTRGTMADGTEIPLCDECGAIFDAVREQIEDKHMTETIMEVAA